MCISQYFHQPCLWRVFHTLQPYHTTIAAMENLVLSIALKKEREQVWILEHPSLFTVGSKAFISDVINSFGLPVIKTGRGGQVTYHGPGQIIAYIMISLKDHNFYIKEYVRFLEKWLIQVLSYLGIQAITHEMHVGVWIPNNQKNTNQMDKIAAIGVRVRRGITYHGIALNWRTDLSYFSGIIPCGIMDTSLGVTSLQKQNININRGELIDLMKYFFYSILERNNYII